ncbi:hypothetical protein PTUN_a0512 [Pseudoalteromonas tunicata]|jgi:hypothetical protein|uniref:Uncharacterized protein n=1 Tax=Pseudoalteromonas tunicata D2 TaxID=87626 RepID=A4C873_9GAMM|nr:hypothetical protein PTUN_a0512 [Pseudoalteromonas tunicata]EAR28788.1 hypothetical protein PTD2_07089 [Pseudoalteromonas tunicata D2]
MFAWLLCVVEDKAEAVAEVESVGSFEQPLSSKAAVTAVVIKDLRINVFLGIRHVIVL